MSIIGFIVLWVLNNLKNDVFMDEENEYWYFEELLLLLFLIFVSFKDFEYLILFLFVNIFIVIEFCDWNFVFIK